MGPARRGRGNREGNSTIRLTFTSFSNTTPATQSTMNPERIHKAIRTIRKRIFDMPENRQHRATVAIQTLKARLPVRHPDRHWMYAAE